MDVSCHCRLRPLTGGSPGPVSLMALECREPALLLHYVTIIRRGVIGSPQSFGVCCPGSSPGAGTSLTLPPFRYSAPLTHMVRAVSRMVRAARGSGRVGWPACDGGRDGLDDSERCLRC